MAKFWYHPNGTKLFPESDFSNVPGLILKEEDAPAPAKAGADRDELAAQYEAKFGKKPHHSMKAETIAAALESE